MTEEYCSPAKIDLSWTKLKNYSDCRQRTKLLMDGKKSKVIDGRVFLPGTLADVCMRAWLTEGKFDTGGMHKFLEEKWIEHTGKNAQYTIKWKNNPKQDQQAVLDKVKDVLTKLEPILLEKVAPYAYKPEYRFKSVIGIPGPNNEPVNISILGAVDVAVYKGNGEYGLYDLKVTENNAYIQSTLAQLTFYDLAFWGWTGVKPVEHEFWAPLLPEPRIATIVTDVERRQMMSRIVDYCQGVWAGNWQLTRDESLCYNCPVKHACPRWINSITVDEQGKNRASFSRASIDYMSEPEEDSFDQF